MQQWDEWWLDLHTPECVANVQDVMRARILEAGEKGCDGVDPDNVDSVGASSSLSWSWSLSAPGTP